MVVGGGPTGVELAGALGEIARQTLKGNFRRINPAEASVLLVEGADRVLPPYPARAVRAKRSARSSGWASPSRPALRVTDIEGDCVTVEQNGGRKTIPTCTVLWAAGVQASPLGKALGEASRRRSRPRRPRESPAEPDPARPLPRSS